jgi:hypothetical protein
MKRNLTRMNREKAIFLIHEKQFNKDEQDEQDENL